jgi:ABC-type transporter Mla subunit MlaD
MNRNLRLALFVIGVVMVVCSLAALAYAYWPVEMLSEQATVVPALFSPP